MAGIAKTKQIVMKQMRFTSKATPILIGPPGGGKSSIAVQIGEEMGYTRDRILVVHINNYDVVDFTGVPSVVHNEDGDGFTIFNPTKFFYDFREGTGGGLIIFEEVPQSNMLMQTWFAGFELERETPSYKLDPDVRMICTGNRQEDKAGAKPMLGHLQDRLWFLDVETSSRDYRTWALQNGINKNLIAFLELRPELLNQFLPTRRSNPTQRSWSKISMDIPPDMPTDEYLILCAAKVGEGAAAEWVAAKDMMDKMPSIEGIRAAPTSAEVPTEPAVRFAVATAMSTTCTEDTFANDMAYIKRMPLEFATTYLTDVCTMIPALQRSQPFIDWSIKNQSIFTGGE